MDEQKIANVVDNLIQLELSLSQLYKFFSKAFPDDSKFWSQLSGEEIAHSNLLINYKNYLPIEFQRMDKKMLIKTDEDIRTVTSEFKAFPPTLSTALNLAYTIENTLGELHYQGLLDANSNAERIKVFQILNFADKDHAKRINSYMIKKREESE